MIASGKAYNKICSVEWRDPMEVYLSVVGFQQTDLLKPRGMCCEWPSVHGSQQKPLGFDVRRFASEPQNHIDTAAVPFSCSHIKFTQASGLLYLLSYSETTWVISCSWKSLVIVLSLIGLNWYFTVKSVISLSSSRDLMTKCTLALYQFPPLCFLVALMYTFSPVRVIIAFCLFSCVTRECCRGPQWTLDVHFFSKLDYIWLRGITLKPLWGLCEMAEKWEIKYLSAHYTVLHPIRVVC